MDPTPGRFEMDKFDGKGDFGMWKYKLLGQLEIQGLSEVLQDGATLYRKSEKQEEGSEPVLDPIKVARNVRVKNLLGSCLSDVILRKIMHEETALGMWKALENDYQTKSLPNRIYLKQMFASYKTIEENLDSFLKLIADLASLNIKISDEDQAIQVLSGLPPPYEPLVHTLKYGMGKDTITLKEVTTSAYAKEVELRQKGLLGKSKAASEGLYVENRGRSEKRNDYKGGNNRRSKSKGNDKHRSKSKSKFRPKACWICGDENHWKKDCPKKKGNNQNKPPSTANIATVLPITTALTVSLYDPKEKWVLDSGCTFHITPRKDLLSDFEDLDEGNVLMGNNTVCEVKGRGTITIDNPDGSVVILSNVRYIPEMGRNLISYGQLEQSGCKYSGGDFKVEFYKGDKKVLVGKYEQGLYYLQGQIRVPEVNAAKAVVDMTKRWHSRLAHMSLSSMEILVRKGLLKSEEVKQLEFCEACTMGKSHKQSFKKAKHTTNEILGYVHSDLWGSPNVTPSLSGARYFLTMIDNYSRKVWIYFQKTKDEAYQNFADWKVLVENQTGKKLKCLRTDNGLEFCNQQYDKLCRESGVKRHKTCLYTPQQNGVSERMNRTIMDKVKSMLQETGLEGEFWAEAASTAVYIINRSPSSAIEFEVPEYLWTGIKPGYSHLRRFGCVAYVHTVSDKISPRDTKGILLGYAQGTKGYMIWLLDDLRVTVSKDVVFNEDQVYKQRDSETTQTVQATGKQGKRKVVTFSDDLVEYQSEESEQSEQSGQSTSVPSSVQGGAAQNTETKSESESSSSSDDETEEKNEVTQDLSEYLLARDRDRRQTKKPSKYGEADIVAFSLICADSINLDEPKSYAEAQRSKDKKLWNAAEDEEMDSLIKNLTWILTNKPTDQKVIGCRWLYRLKPGIPKSELPRHKARLVAKGYARRN
ncbi:unnamed protein product [Microthlaspi erraticum]|uniref:Integrase catalytic domain-containing protein n=1 Tax=Microthlaspi erraticum TaxID=1685480 RepID=A0A6D2HHW8_9BRAS|nr:unnamed protein product [Microthlaspi erraticum]